MPLTERCVDWTSLLASDVRTREWLVQGSHSKETSKKAGEQNISWVAGISEKSLQTTIPPTPSPFARPDFSLLLIDRMLE